MSSLLIGLTPYFLFPEHPLLSLVLLFLACSCLVLYPARRALRGLLETLSAHLLQMLGQAADGLKAQALHLREHLDFLQFAQITNQLSGEIERQSQVFDQGLKTTLRSQPSLQAQLVATSESVRLGLEQACRQLTAPALASHLGGLTPPLGRIGQGLREMGELWKRLDSQAVKLVAGLSTWEAHRSGESQELGNLRNSWWLDLGVGLLAVAILSCGSLLNAQLIQRPLMEMVDVEVLVFGVPFVWVAPWILVGVETALGFLLMDALGATSLLVDASRLAPRLRSLLPWISALMLLTLACLEAGLGMMRESLSATDRLATAQILQVPGALNQTAAESAWPTIIQAALSFILPWVLAFAALPCERFLRGLRLGGLWLGSWGCRLISALLSLVAWSLVTLKDLFLGLYDLAVCLPLALERVWKACTNPGQSKQA